MRRQRASASHQEEKVPWASYADALAGLLFVFILLALSFAYRLQQAKDKADKEWGRLNDKVGQDQRARQIAKDLIDANEASQTSDASVARCLSDAFGVSADTRVQPKATLEEARLSLYLNDKRGASIEWFSSG